MNKLLLILTSILFIVGCSSESQRKQYDERNKNRRYHAKCFTANGVEYYNKVVTKIQTGHGLIFTYSDDGKEDTISGSCKVEEFDIRDKGV